MNVLPNVVCGRCARLSLECTYGQAEEDGPYSWWCEDCLDQDVNTHPGQATILVDLARPGGASTPGAKIPRRPITS